MIDAESIQVAWDSVDSLPPIIFTEDEARAMFVALTGEAVNPLVDREINWLVHQLEAWPTRVDPERTINVQHLLQEAAKHIRHFGQDYERLYTRWLAGNETLDFSREQNLRFQARSDREVKERAR